jgi:hypothetical protein
MHTGISTFSTEQLRTRVLPSVATSPSLAGRSRSIMFKITKRVWTAAQFAFQLLTGPF